FTLFIMMSFIFTSVILRALGSPLLGSVEVVQFLMVVAIMCALPYSEYKNSHIFVDILFNTFPKVIQKPILLVINLLTIIIMASIGVIYFQMALNNNETSHLLSLSFTLFKYLISVSFILWFLLVLGKTFSKRDEC